ncbi:Keratin, type I cytoskeletal 13 [Bagarius yarrelli]|uniref:Keratin, type I cytoskeletal 13 n=1 Tax=Bagarius yarrelli TaxID=175774 RepID=A0A556U5V0_BAGYA|nr:Keratin, type I cytoskeletal 13 [Bagarius yarrelli]
MPVSLQHSSSFSTVSNSKVHSLEKTNQTLEQKIKEFYEKKSSITRTDLSKYYIIIEDLQKQIISKAAENKKVYIILDNANLAASDFKLKFESERNLHLIVEADVTRLRTLLGELEVENKGLESQKTGLEEELSFLKKGHEEDMHMLRNQKSNTVNVQIDCPPAVNLDKELEEMRVHYEALILNNRNQLEQWFKSKTETLNTEVFESHTEITSSQKALSELKKTYQTLEIKIKAVQTQIQDATRDNGGIYLNIDNAKLAADDFRTNAKISSSKKVKVKTVVEEMVDGKVVSSITT